MKLDQKVHKDVTLYKKIFEIFLVHFSLRVHGTFAVDRDHI